MRVAIYSFTRDRLEYTIQAFRALRKKAGHPFDHFVLDNGSTDGTPQWLNSEGHRFKKVWLKDHNLGLHVAHAQLGYQLLHNFDKYDLVIKVDNDIEPITPNILAKVVQFYEDKVSDTKIITSPLVMGLGNPDSVEKMNAMKSEKFTLTNHVGGAFMCIPKAVFYPMISDKLSRPHEPDLKPMARGLDSDICRWNRDHGGQAGYLGNLEVMHIDTTYRQSSKFPEYFKRKTVEEHTPYSESEK